MKQNLSISLLTALVLLGCAGLSAQVFYTQEFNTAGLPTGWTATDASTNTTKVLWKKCAGPNAGCVNLYGAPPFSGANVANGFVVVDSDKGGQLPSDHIAQLTSAAINCTGKNEVYAIFENYIAVDLLAADETAILRVSTDKINWTPFKIFDGLTPSVQLSDNPYVAGINISSVAANKATVYLQWQWTAEYEYWWHLDNVRLTTQNPTPRNDLKISDFYYPVSSYSTPEAHIATDTFAFFAFVSNNGTKAQQNVEVKSFIIDQFQDIIHIDSVTIDELAPGVKDSLIELPNTFVPDLNFGLYAVAYTVTSDSIDGRPSDNLDGDQFEVTDLIFAKESDPTGGLQPGTGGDYSVANLYKTSASSVEKFKASTIDFAAATNSGFPLGNLVVEVSLLEVNDQVANNFDNFTTTDFVNADLSPIGAADYDFPDSSANYQLQNVALTDIATGNAGVPLENGKRYLAAVSFNGANKVAYMAFNNQTKHFFVSTLVYANQWYVNGFGLDENAVIRLNLDLVSLVDEKPLPDQALVIAPNPVTDRLNMNVRLDAAENITLTVADLTGRVISTEDHPAVQNEIFSRSVAHLPAGTYLARLATPSGTSTKKFVVQK